MSYVFKTIIVPLAKQVQAQTLCSQLAGPPGSGMFTAGVSNSGVSPATHFVSTGLIEAQFSSALSDPNVLYAACQAASISITLPQCISLLSASDVSSETPQTALNRLGLKLIPEGL